jgi:hypothetical protein
MAVRSNALPQAGILLTLTTFNAGTGPLIAQQVLPM